MHAVECSGQRKEDARNQVEVVDEPQLQSSRTVSKQVYRTWQQPVHGCTDKVQRVKCAVKVFRQGGLAICGNTCHSCLT